MGDERAVLEKASREESSPEETAARTPVLGDAAAVRRAAADLAAGCVVVHGFGPGYALTARADRELAARVDRLTGRPDRREGPDLTTVPTAVRGLFDWTRLPAELPRRQIWSLMEELYELGPFGFRGPAATGRLPAHLTTGTEGPDGVKRADGARTVRVIAPGRRCPSNAFLAAALERTGTGFLLVAPVPPAARADVGGEPDVRVLAHPDEAAARQRHPYHAPAPAPVSVIAFHRAAGRGRAGLPALVLERAGSLSEAHIRSLAANHGFALVTAARAERPRAQVRGSVLP